MGVFRCNRCGIPPRGLEFEADRGECPKCGTSGVPNIHELVPVHFIVMDRSGPILGAEGRQFVACQKRRDVLGRHRYDQFFATGSAMAVTCPSCKGTKWWQDAAAAIPGLREALEIEANFIKQQGGCCG